MVFDHQYPIKQQLKNLTLKQLIEKVYKNCDKISLKINKITQK